MEKALQVLGFFFDFWKRGRGGQQEGEQGRNINVRNTDQLPLVCALTEAQAQNLNMCSEWE